MKYDDVLKEALKRFRQAYDAESKNREHALDDINFRHGDQWEESVKSERESQNRPCLTINKLEQRVDQVTGDQRMNRMGAIVRPLDSQPQNGNFTLAEVYSGIIKNIEATSNAKTAYDTAFDHAVGHGFGYWRIITEYSDDDGFDQDIKVKRIPNAFTCYLDPAATEITKKDAMWGFVTSMEDKEDYPDGQWDLGSGEDRRLWADNDKVRIAEYFRRVPIKATLWMMPDGRTIRVKDDKIDIEQELTEQGQVPKRIREVDTFKVEWYKLTMAKVYEKKDFPSKYIPIIPCYGKELNVHGETYYRGVIRYAKDPQRIYNYTRTASVEQVALAPKAPFIMEEGQLGTHAKAWRDANTSNKSVLLYKAVPGQSAPQRQPSPQPSSGWLSESAISDQDIDAASGMYKSSLGAPSNERSGKAINARKVEGDVGVYHFHDNRALSLQHSYEIMVDMIPRVYDTDRIVRIKKFDDKEEMVKINTSVFDDESQSWVKVYDLSQGKYDVMVDIGASYGTQRQMASESMMELIQYAPQTANKILPIIAKNLDWPGADEIADVLTEKPITEQDVQQAVQQALGSKDEQRKDKETGIKQQETDIKRMKLISDIFTDDDKVNIELMKLLNDANIADEEIYARAQEIINQMGEQQQMFTQPGATTQQ